MRCPKANRINWTDVAYILGCGACGCGHELALQLDPLCNDYIFWFEAPSSEGCGTSRAESVELG